MTPVGRTSRHGTFGRERLPRDALLSTFQLQQWQSRCPKDIAESGTLMGLSDGALVVQFVTAVCRPLC